MSRFRGTACDQCKAEGKHPGHGLPDAPLPGWHRITHESGAAYDFCSIKCAIDWLKERKRKQAELATRRAGLDATVKRGDETMGKLVDAMTNSPKGKRR